MKYVTDFNKIKLLRPRRQIPPIIPLVTSVKPDRKSYLKTLRFFSIRELLKPKSQNSIEFLTNNENIKQLIKNCSQLNTRNINSEEYSTVISTKPNNINKVILRSQSSSALLNQYVSTTPKVKLPKLKKKFQHQSCKNLLYTNENETRSNDNEQTHILKKSTSNNLKTISIQESKIKIKNFGYFSKLPNLAKSKTDIGNNNSNNKDLPKQESFNINDFLNNPRNNNIDIYDMNDPIRIVLKKHKHNKKRLSPISSQNSFTNFIEPPPHNRKCTYFIRTNLHTKLLGIISLFCVLNGIGEYGYFICKKLSSFLINYFSNSTTIPVSHNRDNYYTIISTAFEEANKHLKTISYIDTSKNGASCILLYIPSNKTSDIYCANVGNCKCVIMNYQKSSPLSYAHKPELACELERIQICGGIVKNSYEIGNVGRNINVKVISDGKGRDVRVFDGKEGDKGIGLSRVMGMFQYEKVGVIGEPEIIGWNVAKEVGRCIVIGTKGLWDWINNEEVAGVVKHYYRNYNAEGAGVAILEKAMENYRKYGKVGELEEIVGIVVFVATGR